MKNSFTTLLNRPSAPRVQGVPKDGLGYALPVWLRISWLYLMPFAVAFAGRIAWEKTVWTIVRGPQMVGFSLAHLHPEFFLVGIVFTGLLMLWLIPATICMIKRREFISAIDITMFFIAPFVAAAMLTPDTFFASHPY